MKLLLSATAVVEGRYLFGAMPFCSVHVRFDRRAAPCAQIDK